ncbi:MAG: hypothetical protein IJ460_05055 [Clostridia bacterium]|nr:hypothetical protein [Clostridia bacterium]
MLNHSDKEAAFKINDKLRTEKVIYGNGETIRPYDASVLKLKQF